jgi:hypothetical protein
MTGLARWSTVVVIDDRVNAAVIRRHDPQIRGGQPTQRAALEPAAFLKKLVQDLVVGCQSICPVLHSLCPSGEQLLGTIGLVEAGHCATNVWGPTLGVVRFVGPKVEKRHVTGAIRPRAWQKQLGELVELEINVEEGHRLSRLLELIQQEDGLQRQRLEAKCL